MALCEMEDEAHLSRNYYMLITVLDFTGKWMGCLSSRTALKKLEYLRQTEQPLKREISNIPRLLVMKRKRRLAALHQLA